MYIEAAMLQVDAASRKANNVSVLFGLGGEGDEEK